MIDTQQTTLGFRDITDQLQKGYYQINKDDVIRNVLVTRRNKHRFTDNPKAYAFFSDEYNLRGIVFPFDEIIEPNQSYDIIIQKILRNNQQTISDVDAHVYHDLNPGEKLTVRISRREPNADPSFKIFKYLSGFVKDDDNSQLYSHLKVGSIVVVEVINVIRTANQGLHTFVKPLDLIAET